VHPRQTPTKEEREREAYFPLGGKRAVTRPRDENPKVWDQRLKERTAFEKEEEGNGNTRRPHEGLEQ